MDIKTKRRMMILETARDVFISKGYNNTIMDDIAKGANITRRTLYRYFKTKEDIGYETILFIMDVGNEYCEKLYRSMEGRGIDRLNQFLHGVADFMNQEKKVKRFIAEFDIYYQSSIEGNENSGKIEKYFERMGKTSDIITKMIRQGMEDGSIKKNVNAELTGATIYTFVWNIVYPSKSVSKKAEKILFLNKNMLLERQINIFIEALKS